MPILRAGGKLIYFAHVPKCGGTSVNDYLARRFGPLVFLDGKSMSLPETARRSKTPPQHVEAASLARLFPRRVSSMRPSRWCAIRWNAS